MAGERPLRNLSDPILSHILATIVQRGEVTVTDIDRARTNAGDELSDQALYDSHIGPAVDDIEAGIIFWARHAK